MLRRALGGTKTYKCYTKSPMHTQMESLQEQELEPGELHISWGARGALQSQGLRRRMLE